MRSSCPQPALSFDEEEDAAEVAAKQLLKEKRRKEKRNKKLGASLEAMLEHTWLALLRSNQRTSARPHALPM